MKTEFDVKFDKKGMTIKKKTQHYLKLNLQSLSKV